MVTDDLGCVCLPMFCIALNTFNNQWIYRSMSTKYLALAIRVITYLYWSKYPVCFRI